jgi:hypothetical protein
MRLIYQSIYQHQLNNNSLPTIDDYQLKNGIFTVPDNNFVLCRQADGKPTAIYGNPSWSFKPYNTSQNSHYAFHFNFFNGDSQLSDNEQLSLVDEVKRILFLLIYFLPDMGRTGSMSIKILGKRFQSLKKIALYSEKTKSTFLLNDIKLHNILTNELYLADYVSTLSENQKSELSDLLANLKRIDQNHLGYQLIDFYQARGDTEQTPIIPSSIYLHTFFTLKKEIESFWQVKDNLTNLIKEFTDKVVGYSIRTQEKNGIHSNFRPTLKELLVKHSLDSFFRDNYAVGDKRRLVTKLINIQVTCKYYIHQYIALRHNEALRIKYMCIKSVELADNKLAQGGKLLPDRFVNVISTTTKLSGYYREVGWLAPEAINKGVEVLQALVRGIAHLLNTVPERLPLFQSVTFITQRKANGGSTVDSSKVIPICLRGMTITKADRQELMNSDPKRSFNELAFQVGQPWKFASHQFRRSLAFFGANSNLISESTGASLFKQLNHDMQRYYRKGFNNIISILGYFNKETKEMELPTSHFIFEFRTGMAIDQAREIINLLFKDNEALGGKRGSYIERQRIDLKDDEVKILEFKSDTERKALQGELSYKKTLVGGCMKDGRCKFYMLGNFTACIGCDDAVIESKKVENVIKEMKIELTSYELESGEYQLTKSELDQFEIFQAKELRKRGFNNE